MALEHSGFSYTASSFKDNSDTIAGGKSFTAHDSDVQSGPKRRLGTTASATKDSETESISDLGNVGEMVSSGSVGL